MSVKDTCLHLQVKLLTSGQIQALQPQQQQQLQQLYLQQQAQVQQQQQVAVLNSSHVNTQAHLDNTKNVTNHASFQGSEAENHVHLNANQAYPPGVPGASLHDNWSESTVPQVTQNGVIANSSSSGVQASTTQGISNQSVLISQPQATVFSQADSFQTQMCHESTVSAMETAYTGAQLLQVNATIGSDSGTLSSLSSNFVSTSSDVLLSQSVVCCQGTTLTSSGLVTTASMPTSEPSLHSGIDTTILSEINCSSDAKSSPLTGNSDPTLSNGPISSYSAFSTSNACASGMAISPFSSPNYVMSPTQKSPFHTGATLSPSITQPLSINPSCLSPSSGLHGGHSAFSPSLIPSDLLSPTKQLAVISPASSKSPFNLSSGGDSLAVPKLNLFFDSMAIPCPPPMPTPPLPTDKLSPQTPSIYVSIILF